MNGRCKRMEKLYVAAMDLGGSGGKVQLGGYDGSRLEMRTADRFRNESVRLLNEQYWDFLHISDAFSKGLRSAAAEADGEIAALAATTFGHSVVLFDRAGRFFSQPYAVYPGRLDSAMKYVKERISPFDLHLRTGAEFRNYLTVVQLCAYLTNQEKQILDMANSALLWPDALNYVFGGEMCAERTAASVGGLYNLEKADWDVEIACRMGLNPQLMQPICESGHVLGEVRRDIRAAAGVRSKTKLVCAPGHDTASAIFAMPAEGAFISMGTMGLTGWTMDAPVANEYTFQEKMGNYALPENKNMLMTATRCMWYLERCRDALCAAGAAKTYEEISAMAAAREGGRFLIDLNDDAYLEQPENIMENIALYCSRTGQGEMNGAADVLRCIFDSIAWAIVRSFRTFENVMGRMPEQVCVLGGGGRNAYLMQLIADALGAKLIVPEYEATSCGVLLSELIALGELSGAEQAKELVRRSVPIRTYAPQRSCDLTYAERLYENIIPLREALA